MIGRTSGGRNERKALYLTTVTLDICYKLEILFGRSTDKSPMARNQPVIVSIGYSFFGLQHTAVILHKIGARTKYPNSHWKINAITA
jgi:hypothetical protein